MSVTPEACRAGRAILKWSMRELGERAGVAWTTINRLEAGTDARDATAAKIVAAFAAEGVELVADGARTGALLLHSRDAGTSDGV
ncbi:helix-turn-helix domain-containing protein [Phenylobacterium sp.]|uniref:helix-turn-helix domain-containing protein n=1 Tax=Phenylobacterium sp. TaxID=1871053 RepID=UPI00351E95FA